MYHCREKLVESYVRCEGIEADALFDEISWIHQCCQCACDSCHDD